MLSRQCEPVQDAIRGVARETCRCSQAVALNQERQGFEYHRARAAQGLEERMLIRTEGVSARRAVRAPLHVAEGLDVAGSDFPVVGASRVVAPLLSQFHDASPPERDDTSGGRSRLTDTLGIFHGLRIQHPFAESLGKTGLPSPYRYFFSGSFRPAAGFLHGDRLSGSCAPEGSFPAMITASASRKWLGGVRPIG
jgi:hypothetical protein